VLKVDLSHACPRRPGAVPLRTLTCVTSGLCLGYLQADLVVLPAKAAAAFQEFWLANPRRSAGGPTLRRVTPGPTCALTCPATACIGR
jgi:uncharacterized protein YcsI (UPF0317 family)